MGLWCFNVLFSWLSTFDGKTEDEIFDAIKGKKAFRFRS